MTAQSTTTPSTTTTLAQHGGERQSPAPAKQERAQSEAPRWNDSVQPVADLIRAVVTVCDGVVDTDTLTIGTRVQHSYYCQIYYDLHGVQFRFPKRAHTKTVYRTVLRREIVAMLNAARESARPQPPAPAVVAANVEPPVPPSGEWFGRVTVSAFGAGRRQVFARPAWATPEPPYANYRFDPQTGGYDEFAPYRSVAHEAPF